MKSLQARFDSLLEATNAVKTLKEHGYGNAHIDAAGFFHDEHAMDLSFTHDRRSHSLSSLILKKGNFIYNTGKGPLTVAGPDVSGISIGERNDLNAVVLVKVEEEQAETAGALLKECGGRT